MEDHDDRLARAISAGSRRNILRLLADQELPVKEIARRANLSLSLASRHLQLLRDLGFVQVKKKHPSKYYSLRIKEVKLLLEQYDKVISKL